MSKRAERREHKKRMKKKAIKLFGFREAIKYADHMCVCTCFMCARDRKYLGRTIQEKRRISKEDEI